MARLCVVDDKALVRDSITETLRAEDHEVDSFGDPQTALEQIVGGRYDVVLTDLQMPQLDGIGLLTAMRDRDCLTPLIVMTAFGTVHTAVEAMRRGAFNYIQKPFEAEVICAQVEQALAHGRLAKENEALRTSLADARPARQMVGDSDAMIQLRIAIARMARSLDTVLIAGESGTGKELVAQAIHQSSARGDQPLLCLNCAALSASLLESELFGHERGAFTGADRARKGRFELADGGTLFLDEISEMALPLQAKLLRVLQEGEFERVGSSVTRRVDVRIIATTNRRLDEWVEQKRFRADLYYRLNVLPIELLPLRERRSDIPALASYFLEQVATATGSPPVMLGQESLGILMDYPWPGNVRELENVCRRAAALTVGSAVDAEQLAGWLQGPAAATSSAPALRHGRMLEDMERQLIERTLAQFGGHRAKSAKALGMGVRTLGMKLKQWREEASAVHAAMPARR